MATVPTVPTAPNARNAPTAPTVAFGEDEELVGLLAAATERIAAADALDELEGCATDLLGPHSVLGARKRALAKLDPSERPSAGAVLNSARQALEALVASRRESLKAEAVADRLETDRLDLTEVLASRLAGHLHVVTQVREELEDIFLGLGYEIAEGLEVETDWYNFSALNVPRDHPARSMQDSFYLEIGDHESLLLRTHTSPVQVHLLERGVLPIYAVAPGRVYRRDTADARHLPVFHQIEGLVVDEGVSFADLAGTVEVSMQAIFGPSTRTRLRPAYFPFTEPSAEFDITCAICAGSGCRTCGGVGWIELGGCGLIHPAVLEATGVDAERYSGFALGFGIDRIAIMRHGIEDMRVLLENDVRFLTQL